MLFKKNKSKVLSQVKKTEFDEVVLKIQELFRRNGMTISVEDIKNYKDWTVSIPYRVHAIISMVVGLIFTVAILVLFQFLIGFMQSTETTQSAEGVMGSKFQFLIGFMQWNETLVTSVMQCLRRGKVSIPYRVHAMCFW